MPFGDIIGQAQPVALLQAALEHGRLAHAYLFHGEDRIGKRLTAVRLAQAIACETGLSGRDSCGECRSCRQIESRTHPDFFLIEPDAEAAAPQIKIEQVREIDQQIIYEPLVSPRKMCVIDQADRMTIGAANALLKTLEEPPGHSLFLLISSRPSALPSTIRSRCQALRFSTPSRTQVEAAVILRREVPPADARFLALLSEGRLGEALTADVKEARARQNDFLSLVRPSSLQSAGLLLSAAESLAKTDRAAEALGWLARWIRDVVIVAVGGDRDQLLHVEQLDMLESAASRANVDELLLLLNDIETMEQNAARHLNLQMALETILLRLRSALDSVSPARSA